MTKTCIKCNIEKPIESFILHKHQKDGRRNTCRECTKEYYIKRMLDKPFDKLHRNKKAECKKKGIPYNLDIEYLNSIWTGCCPVFSIDIIKYSPYAKSSDLTAHLDRIDPNKGYIKGNVAFLSSRANRLKNNASIEELKKILRYMLQSESATTISKESTSETIADGSGEPVEIQ